MLSILCAFVEQEMERAVAKREVISTKVVAGRLPARRADVGWAGSVALLPWEAGQCDVVLQAQPVMANTLLPCCHTSLLLPGRPRCLRASASRT